MALSNTSTIARLFYLEAAEKYFFKKGNIMRKISIGRCTLGTIPRTVAIVDQPLDLKVIRRLKTIGADMLEMRVDCFKDGIDEVCGYIEKVKRYVDMPIIGTIRENGKTKGRRLEFFAKVIPLVDAIDIEVGADIALRIRTLAGGKTIIVSEHDFSRTPTSKQLSAIASRAAKLGGHIVKIAAMARRPDDVIRLFNFIRSSPMPIVAFSMGEIGAVSRVLSMLYGSLYSYGYVTCANAPGQLSIEKLIEELRLYYPSMKK